MIVEFINNIYINLLLILIMKILIRDSKGHYSTINISGSNTVSKLKEIIKTQNKIKIDIELIFNGMILEDSYTLDELDIEEGNTIDYLGTFLAGLNK